MSLKLRLYKIWYGVRFFERTNCKDTFILASYHHPDSITWRWSLSFSLPDHASWCFPKIGPSYSMGTKYRSPNGDFSGWIRLPFGYVINLSTQKHMWRNSND